MKSLDSVNKPEALANCDNTSDANKPVSTTVQTALDGKAPLIQANLTATRAPNDEDDVNFGYAVGSLWINVTGNAVYMAVDVTSEAAIWALLGLAGET